jgi:hypothetical protein
MKSTSHHDEHEHDPTNRLLTDGGERAPIGAHVVDRDADEPNPAVVVDQPDEPAYAHTLDALDGEPTVADLNPDYGASGGVATVAFAGELDDADPEWRHADPAALAGLCDDHGVKVYDFPTERLREVDS